MFTATLGGLIKDYRLKKRLLQLEVSLRIGWKDTTRLSKIEQGRVSKPTRETAEKIIKALELTDEEKGEFLYMGGYQPTDSEIKEIIKEFKTKVDSWQHPAYIMDFSWRLLYVNKISISIFGMDLSWVDIIRKNRPNAVEFAFLSKDIRPADVWKGESEDKLKPIEIAQVAAFKTETFHYQNEYWFKKTIQSLMKYERFREIWPKISLQDYHKKLLDYEYKRIIETRKGKKKIYNFHIFTTKLINDPRFQIVMYYPV